jgi:hypothetical protein
VQNLIESSNKKSKVVKTCSLHINYLTSVDLTEDERTSLLSAPEFLEFVEMSSKIVQRALNDNYDYIRDYTVGTESGG